MSGEKCLWECYLYFYNKEQPSRDRRAARIQSKHSRNGNILIVW
jgi:hypothetical protein